MSLLDSKIALLTKPVWTISDIKNYFNCSISTASRKKIEAIEKYDGKTSDDRFVKVDSVLAIYGTNTKEQLERLSAINEKEL